MKFLFPALLALSCVSHAGNEKDEYVLVMDDVWDGSITRQTEYTFDMVRNSNQLSSELDSELLLTGELLDSEAVVSFSIGGMQILTHFLGGKLDSNKYAGSWFSREGGSGDWELVKNSGNGGLVTPYSCNDILVQGQSAGDGYYTIDPDGDDIGVQPFQVYCDMTTMGGGWTLFANHKDDLASNAVISPVSPSEYGVLSDEQWLALRVRIDTGILVVDEFDRLTYASKETMNPAEPHNHITPWSVNSLLTANSDNYLGYIWCAASRPEACDGTAYINTVAGIALGGERFSWHTYAGATVYELNAPVNFDIWPYSGSGSHGRFSHTEQNELLYYLK